MRQAPWFTPAPISASLDGAGDVAYYGYDGLNRLVQRKTPRGDAVYYAYDAASDLLSLEYPQDAKAAYFGYDAALRLEMLCAPGGPGRRCTRVTPGRYWGDLPRILDRTVGPSPRACGPSTVDCTPAAPRRTFLCRTWG